MTTIAIREYHDRFEVATDSLATTDHRMFFAKKIYKVSEASGGGCLAITGNGEECDEFATAYSRGDKPEPRGDGGCQYFHVRPDGIFVSDSGKHFVRVKSIEGILFAGSGGVFAAGAMSFGADVRQALEVAIKHDIYTGGPIQHMVIHKRKRDVVD